MTVYYGEWEPGRIHDEIINAVDGSKVYPAGVTAPSGWFVGDVSGYAATSSRIKDSAGGIGSPPPEDTGNSIEAFDTAYAEPTDHFGDRQATALEYAGNLSYLGLSQWRQVDQWTLRGSYWRLAYTSPTVPNWEAGSAPPPEEWPEWADGVEVDHSGNRITLIRAKVWGTGDVRWRTFYKEPFITAPWFASLGEPGYAVGASMLTEVDGEGVPMSIEDLQALIDEHSTSPISVDDPRLPSGTVVYDWEWPGDVAGPANTYRYDGPWGGVTLTYRYPNWRYWSYEPIPVEDEIIYRAPRRVFPRDDGLTGGARRTWPPSKGYQWGNRVDGSGYL